MKSIAHPKLRVTAILLPFLLALAAACGDSTGPYGTGGGGGGGGGGGALASGRTLSISMKDEFFTPKLDTVTVGSTVTWTNEGALSHTTTSDGGLWSSGTLTGGQGQTYGGGSSSGASFQHTFGEVGEFPYHCDFHGAAGGVGMAGTVVVIP